MKIIVLGAGAWGTALAIAAAQGRARHVRLWGRDAALQRGIAATRENARYLPGIALPGAVELAWGPLAPLVADCDLAVVATPVAGLRVPVAWACKGFEQPRHGVPGGLLPHEVCAQVNAADAVAAASARPTPGQPANPATDARPTLLAGALSGPSFALEVARGQPTALVAASAHPAVRDALVAAFHSPTLRVYANDDLTGVEVGGAVKNVVAIATGLADGLALGLNARAALVTRGLAETARLGAALGARAETFMGLSGLGDLVLTATGDLSRNRRVGLALAEGRALGEIVATLGHVAEGVQCARAVAERAAALGVEMPITRAVVDVLDGRLHPRQAVAELMAREPAAE